MEIYLKGKENIIKTTAITVAGRLSGLKELSTKYAVEFDIAKMFNSQNDVEKEFKKSMQDRIPKDDFEVSKQKIADLEYEVARDLRKVRSLLDDIRLRKNTFPIELWDVKERVEIKAEMFGKILKEQCTHKLSKEEIEEFNAVEIHAKLQKKRQFNPGAYATDGFEWKNCYERYLSNKYGSF